MQKSGVRALSIIDTLSELARQTEAGSGSGELRHLSTPPGLGQGTAAEAAAADNLTASSIDSAPYYHYPLNNPPPPPTGDALPVSSASVRQRRQAPPPPPLPPMTLGPEPPSLQPRSPKVVNIVQPSPPKVRLRSQHASPSPAPLPLTVSPLNKSALEIGPAPTSVAKSPTKTPVTNGNGARGARQRRPLANGGGGAPPSSSRGHTPDWIRDIFLNAKRGIIEKLVRFLRRRRREEAKCFTIVVGISERLSRGTGADADSEPD